eukprot:scaffold19_cov114-Cylindrotheca_fusiformis.AAC.42
MEQRGRKDTLDQSINQGTLVSSVESKFQNGTRSFSSHTKGWSDFYIPFSHSLNCVEIQTNSIEIRDEYEGINDDDAAEEGMKAMTMYQNGQVNSSQYCCRGKETVLPLRFIPSIAQNTPAMKTHKAH